MDFNLIDDISNLAELAWQQMITNLLTNMNDTPHKAIQWIQPIITRWPHLLSPHLTNKQLPCLEIEYSSNNYHYKHGSKKRLQCPITLKFLSLNQVRSGVLSSILHQSTCIFMSQVISP
mmetsp:Transcript_21589/g.25542  ORF Transcript_21589/g.25542 Transcript_21589/m.25542 type:complete len:119 (+) Transcript_21589:281-637(+)